MGTPEGKGGGEGRSISHMLRHPSARQCYFEMKTIYAPEFSILSSLILCIPRSIVYCSSVLNSVFQSLMQTGMCTAEGVNKKLQLTFNKEFKLLL